VISSPRPDAGQRRVYYDEFCDEAGIFRGERIADHITDVMRDEVGMLDLEGRQHAFNVMGLGLFVVTAGRTSRETHAAQIRRDDRVIFCKLGGEGLPHVAGFAVAMQHHNRRA
jgi:hypothetical protein